MIKEVLKLTEVRLRWPPEMPLIISPPIITSAQPERPRSLSMVSTRAVRDSSGMSLSRRAALKARASRGVAVATKASSYV